MINVCNNRLKSAQPLALRFFIFSFQSGLKQASHISWWVKTVVWYLASRRSAPFLNHRNHLRQWFWVYGPQAW